MKLLVLLLGITSVVHADMLGPESVVTTMVAAAQNNNLGSLFETCDVVKVASHPRHAKSQEQLLSFLRSIDPQKIRYVQVKPANVGAPITVRMIEPIKMEFNLELRERSDGRKDNHFVVIGIHP